MTDLHFCELRGARFAYPADDWMLKHIAAGQEYEPYVLDAFLETVGGKSVLDIGANIGIFSVLAAKRGASVVAVEAAPENAKLLTINLGLNGVTTATVYPVALSDHLGMATFARLPGSNKVVRPYDITPDTIDQIEVTMGMPLDLITDRRFDVVKIDVEGREYACLSGARRLLEQRPMIFTEYSPQFIKDGCGVEGETYLRLFLDLGYRPTILHRDMTREECVDLQRIQHRWEEYMSRNVTHLDLMLHP